VEVKAVKEGNGEKSLRGQIKIQLRLKIKEDLRRRGFPESACPGVAGK